MSPRTKSLWVVAAVLATASLVLWNKIYWLQQRMLTVSFLDVGQGDAILITSPTGRHVLIDGGPDRTVLSALGSSLPLFDRTIDVVIGTHPDGDHVGGLVDVLQRYTVGGVVYQGMKHTAPDALAFERVLKGRIPAAILPHRGDVIELGDGAMLTILYPDRTARGEDTNEYSVVARATYGSFSVLPMGDAPQDVEQHLIALDGRKLHSTIIKLGHHGSKTSSSEEFIGYVHPDVAIISRGCANTYGHPHKEVLDILSRFSVPSYDTCLHGTITINADGTHYTVE
jgi:competence protein ComEC